MIPKHTYHLHGHINLVITFIGICLERAQLAHACPNLHPNLQRPLYRVGPGSSYQMFLWGAVLDRKL